MKTLLISKKTQSAEDALIKRVLADHDVGLETANDYKTAIETLAQRKCTLAIVYSFNTEGDLSMAEAIRIMKQIVPDLLVVAVSEERPLETERELRQAGLYYYLTTPFTEVELRDVLSGAIEKQTRRRTR